VTSLRIAALPLLWFVTAIAMAANYIGDPYSPLRRGTSAYGHNHHGALWHGLLFIAAELMVVGLILRPWSYRQSWGEPWLRGPFSRRGRCSRWSSRCTRVACR
jgi:hypothetical protein